MEKLDDVACGDQYTDAATLFGVYRSNGGYFTVQDNDVFLELEHGVQGQSGWTDEVHAVVGNGVLAPGTTGIRFRNHVPGAVAVVSAALSFPAEPPLVLVSGGLGGAPTAGGASLSVPIILSTSGTFNLVTAVPNELVEVLHVYCMAGGTTTLQFQSSGGAPLSGVLTFVNATGFVMGPGGVWMRSLVGEGLQIINGNNVTVGGVLVYRQGP